MNDDERRAIVQRLHDSPVELVVHATGGGMALITDLLLVPGASRTILEVSVPYAATAMADLLGREPAQAVSDETADHLAAAALGRAERLGDRRNDRHHWGIGITAALATDRTRRGGDRAWIRIVGSSSGPGDRPLAVELDGVPSDRVTQDRAVADAVLTEIDRHLDQLG